MNCLSKDVNRIKLSNTRSIKTHSQTVTAFLDRFSSSVGILIEWSCFFFKSLHCSACLDAPCLYSNRHFITVFIKSLKGMYLNKINPFHDIKQFWRSLILVPTPIVLSPKSAVPFSLLCWIFDMHRILLTDWLIGYYLYTTVWLVLYNCYSLCFID